MKTHWLVGYLSALVAGATKRLPEIRVQPLINPQNMTHMVMYDHVCPLPDVRYDITCWATTTGNALPVIAFPSRNCHTVVITGRTQCPKGPGYRSTGFSGRTGLGLALTMTVSGCVGNEDNAGKVVFILTENETEEKKKKIQRI